MSYHCFTNVVRNVDPATGDESQVFDIEIDGSIDYSGCPKLFTAAGPGLTGTLIARGTQLPTHIIFLGV